MEKFIKGLPKAELHLHIEGTFEPELMFKIAKRNNIKTKYSTVEELKEAYNFNNLQEFLNIYYEGANVLINEADYYDLTYAYLKKVAAENVLHCEIFFDPQTHTGRGVSFETIINGISNAVKDAENEFGISTKLIMCFLRDDNEDFAFTTLQQALKFKDKIIGVGLDSAEVGNPPEKFTKVFEKAIQEGFLTVAHAGEEGPAEYVWSALNNLKVSRIDHGNRSMEDEELLKVLAEKKMPLTVCPLSNLKLQVVTDLKNHPLKEMINKGLFITINSDDPAYFGGYINDNYSAIAKALNLTKEDLCMLAKNSFNASFLSVEEKEKMIQKVDEYYKSKVN
ncbi:MAG: adenosine deaminase [bacterium]